jgi:tRNA threonylcarbamoyladenosine biosynthesis protein TsaB
MGSVALVKDGVPVAEIDLISRETHSRRLMVNVKWLIKSYGVDWSDLDLLGIGMGPGSFTGLRIGLASAKGLAFATGIPLIGIPTIDALAGQVISCREDLICPMVNVRRSQVYTAFYQAIDPGKLERLSPYQVISPEDFVASAPRGHRILLFGDGVPLYRDILMHGLGNRAVVLPRYMAYARAASVGIMAEARWKRHKKADDLKTLRPIYARPFEIKNYVQTSLSGSLVN